MTRAEEAAALKLGPPEVEAAKIRRSYMIFFVTPAFWFAMAVAWAVTRHWLYAAGSAISTLISIPVSLLQYRQVKPLIEKGIKGYRDWWQTENPPV